MIQSKQQMQTVHGVGIADQDMSENKSSGMNMNMNMNMNAIQGSTHASMLGRGCINNSHEPELRRKNEKERNYFTGSTTDDLVLPRSDQFGFERGRRISRGGNGPIVVEGGGSRGGTGTGAARLGGRGRFAMEKSASDRSVGSGSALGSGSSTRMMTSSGTLTSTNTSTSIMSTGSTHTTRSNSIPRGMKYCESLSMDVDL